MINNNHQIPPPPISKAFTYVGLKPPGAANKGKMGPQYAMVGNQQTGQMASFHGNNNKYENMGNFSQSMTDFSELQTRRTSIKMTVKDAPQNNAYINLNAKVRKIPQNPANITPNTRRTFLGTTFLTLGSFMNPHSVQPAFASVGPMIKLQIEKFNSVNRLIDVYFGVGCFWHTQHEFIEAEKNILKRDENQFTSLSGYAGGNKEGKDGAVCYHNPKKLADYGALGHGEVVGMTIPIGSYEKFADEYFKLFDKNGDRPDKNDKGSEYRHMVGIPGGITSPLFTKLKDSATKTGFEKIDFKEGIGNDADNLGKNSIWVYDSNKFPFYQAEVKNQYHDGFMKGEKYGREYNELAQKAYQDGRIKKTQCPDIV